MGEAREEGRGAVEARVAGAGGVVCSGLAQREKQGGIEGVKWGAAGGAAEAVGLWGMGPRCK